MSKCKNRAKPFVSRLSTTCLLVAALCWDVCAASVADAGHVWTLNELIDELKQNNPQLEQARQAYQAARLQVPLVDTLPAPQFGLLEQANTGGPFDFNPDSGFYAYPTFTQPFLWPGKQRLAGEIAKAQAEVVGRQYDNLVIQLVSQLKLSFYQLTALRDQLRFIEENLQRLEQVKEISKVRYSNNAAAYVDFLNAQVAASSLVNDRFNLEKQMQQQTGQINNLLGHPSQNQLEVRDLVSAPQLPATPLSELIEQAQKFNPAAAAGKSQVEAAGKSVELANKAFWPDFSLSVGLFTEPSLGRLGTSRLYSVGVNINLPTWGFHKEKAGLNQARALLSEAAAGQQANLQQIDLSVANAYHNLETALQQLKFTRERLLPQAQAAYRLALTGYSSSGGTSFSDLLTAQTSLRNTELSLIQAENSALQAYIGLSAAIGRDPA
jgi:cobalt-zinc-cadmium efflux system outer membrane protein